MDLHTQPGAVALVTGASRGIGRAIAVALATRGYTIACLGRDGAALAETVAAITAGGGRAVALTADVRDAAAMTAAVAVAEALGPIEVCVANAGGGTYAPVREQSVAALDDMLATNVRGTFLTCQAVLPGMEFRRRGTIIAIASVVAHRGYARQAAYGASKHALLGLCKSLAVEVQPAGIRVSVVSPGAVDTELVRASRPDLDPAKLIRSDDVAEAVCYLVSLPPSVCIDEIRLRRPGAEPFA
jgi:3-oxoacyl-[acyl-carrier protein] reductase